MNARLKNMVRQVLPRWPGRHRILWGPLRGHSLVTSWYDYPAAILGRTERPLLEWLRKNVRAGETWLDVGAHYGYTAIALCRLVGPNGRVYAFEPVAATAGCVSRARLLNGFRQLTVVPVALGSCDDVEILSLPTVRGMVDSTIEGCARDETLLVVRFDWLWPRICRGHACVHGVKIDVQGMELEVLRGMAGFLRRYRPRLIVELHSGVSRTNFLDLLESLGYARHGRPLGDEKQEAEPQYLDDRSYVFQGV